MRAVVITEPGESEVKAVVDRELPMSQVAQAHRVMTSGEHLGKILLLPT